MARAFVRASNQHLSIAAALLSAHPLTFAAWIRPATSNTIDDIITITDGAGTLNGWVLRQNASGQIQALSDAAGSFNQSTSAGAVTNGIWAHAAAVFASAASRLAYLNGVAATPETTSLSPSGLTVTRVGAAFGPQNFYDGDIAEAAIWSVALDAAEVAALAAGVSPLLVRPSALVAYWPLLGQYAPEIDLWRGNDLTVTGATAAAHPRVYGLTTLGPFEAVTPPVFIRDVSIRIAGVEVATRVRLGSLTIHDVLNDAPNTCAFLIEGAAPTIDTSIRILHANPAAPAGQLLFNGTIASADRTYEGGRPDRLIYACEAIDDTRVLNRRRPFGSWTSVSATTIAQEWIASFAPGYTTRHVAADLPSVSIALDGSEGILGAFRQLAKLIGGYFYVEDGDVHLFVEETSDTPDDLDETPPHRFLNDPPIQLQEDATQIRTRVYGKGHGEAVLSDLLAGETIVPIAVTMFNPSGGRAIAARSADQGSTVDRLTYAGTQAGGSGSLVGPGVSPGVAPSLTPTGGTGLGSGVYKYAYTFVTGSGETLPSPLAQVTTGPIPDLGAVLTATTDVGTGVDPGNQIYGVTCVDAAGGETTVQVSSSPVNVHDVAAPAAAPDLSESTGISGTANWPIGATIYVAVTYKNSAGETTLGPNSNSIVATESSQAPGLAKLLDFRNIPTSSDPTVTAKRVYYNINGNWTLFREVPAGTNDILNDSGQSGSAPGSNTAYVRLVRLSNIPIGPTGTVSRKIYRYLSPNFKLQQTINNNTANISTDQTPNASLGANAPGSNTTALNQVVVAGIAIGPSGTTARKVYRTVVNGSQLKLLATISNNTATTLGANDSTVDGSLGADAPTSDTSGLSQGSGLVLAGSTSLVTSSAAPFASGGGWAQIGLQVIRYTGISGNDLTGIPANGPGAILNSVPYGHAIDALPALTGINGGSGLAAAITKGAPIHLWVQVDDTAAQAIVAARDGSDGVIEHLIMDERRGEASLTALCQADLALFARTLKTVTYATRDLKTKSGKPITINLTSPAINDTLTIQEVTITEIGFVSGLAPRFTVRASSVRWSLEDLLRRMVSTFGGT